MKILLAFILCAVAIACAESPADTAKGTLTELLANATWEWLDSGPASAPMGDVKFRPDGTIESTVHYLTTWKKIDGARFRVNAVSGRFWVFRYTSAGRTAVVVPVPDKGSLMENKVLRVKRDAEK